MGSFLLFRGAVHTYHILEIILYRPRCTAGFLLFFTPRTQHNRLLRVPVVYSISLNLRLTFLKTTFLKHVAYLCKCKRSVPLAASARHAARHAL